MATTPKVARLYDPKDATRAELRALGHSIHKQIKRSDLAVWSPGADRRDPVEVLRDQDAGRIADLVPIRWGRMLASPFAFFRGAAAVMAMDLATTPTTGINVQACGDAHVQNFGIYGTPERHLVFDVNDFDETLPGPWEWDLKRLAASIVLYVRELGWDDDEARDAVWATVTRYQQVLGDLSEQTTLDVHYAQLDVDGYADHLTDPDVISDVERAIARANKRTNAQAAHKWVTRVDGTSRFLDDPPLLVRSSDEERERLGQLFHDYRAALQPDRRHVLQQFRFVDSARKVVGVGSVGMAAYVLLLEGRGPDDVLLLQVKQATSSVLTPYLGSSRFHRHGERVIDGQRLMQAASDPFLGWVPSEGQDVYVRQLRDKKGKSERPSTKAAAVLEAQIAGGTLARAHARSLDPGLLAGFVGHSEVFPTALQTFAVAYADQATADLEVARAAAKAGTVPYEPDV